MLREINNYISLAQKAVTDISISAAMAECKLQEGQTVSLIMKGGLLFATKEMKQGAKGIAISNVNRGEDVGVSKIEGFIKLTKGEVTVLSVPDIQQGGSKQVDLDKLKVEIGKAKQVGAIGIEALVALKRAGTDARYFYGVREAATQAAQHGSPFIVICTSSDIPSLLQGLEENNLRYTVRDVRLDISE